MFKKEEERLAKIKEQFQDLKIPEQIDDYIMAGIHQAKKSKKRWRTSTFTTLAAGIMVFLLLASIRISPAFANYVSQVPILERIVALFQSDKGLEAAVENGFIQEVGKSVSHDGVTFTVDGVIADESRMIIFYTLISERDIGAINCGKVSILNESNEEVIGSLSYGLPVDGLKSGEKYKSTFDLELDKDTAPKMIKLEANMEVMYANEKADVFNGNWKVEFTVDQEKFYGKKQVHEVDRTVSVEGQKITFKEIIIYPTRIGVHVKYDEDNTKEIFHFDDLKIVNEKGEEWAGITNGTIAEGINENEEILYLQSNYFTNPKELYLEFSSIRALDKDRLEVVVDLDNKELIKRPNDQLELIGISDGAIFSDEESRELKFHLKRNNKFDENNYYSIFDHRFIDKSGKMFELNDGIGTSEISDSFDSEIYIPIDKIDYHSPITFKILDYPTRITKDVRIQVK